MNCDQVFVNVNVTFDRSLIFYLGAFLLVIGFEKIGLHLIKSCCEIGPLEFRA